MRVLHIFSAIVLSSNGPRDNTVGLQHSSQIRPMDNTPGPSWACVLNEVLDTSLHSYVVSKVYTPSVIKQSDSKCFREAPIVPFHLTRCRFVMTALVHFERMVSSRRNSALHTINTAPSSSTASWHGLYKPWVCMKVKEESLLLFYSTLYSNIHVYILSVTFYDGIS